MKECQGRVLVVDDIKANVDIMLETLGDTYEVAVAIDGESALQAVAENRPDIILLDIIMQGMDGYEVCRRLKADTATAAIPVIFITAMTEVVDETKGLDLGAVDYISKPFSPAIVRARVKTQLSLVLASRELEQQNDILEARVTERTKELEFTQNVTIHCLTTLCETRDNETGSHILRTQRYIKALADKLAPLPKFAPHLDASTIQSFFKCAPLHDIGKVGIPDTILQKPGKLTDAEREIMRTHCALGFQALQESEKMFKLEHIPSFLAHAKDIAYTHHEKWDGSGYPRGIAGDDIPISGRLMAVADVYDALISKRVYKPAFTHEKAVEIIAKDSGTHFDPDMGEAFLAIQEEFKAIATELADVDAE